MSADPLSRNQVALDNREADPFRTRWGGEGAPTRLSKTLLFLCRFIGARVWVVVVVGGWGGARQIVQMFVVVLPFPCRVCLAPPPLELGVGAFFRG